MLPIGPQYGFGLYVHWPYCAKICPYCDFNVYTAKDRDNSGLVDAIVRDIERHKSRLPNHPKLNSLFLGGGTPSLLSADQIEKIISTAEQQFGFQHGAEVTIEANPNDILRSDLVGWTAAGVNRVSLGIQSLNDQALAFLGRDHDRANALKAVDAVQAHFDNHSLDFIYARPGQIMAEWRAELSAALALGAPHLSLYELTIAERTAFGKRAERGDLIPMQDDAQADLYDLTQDLCEAAGLPAYEVSNHARGKQYEAIHNHIYWNSGDWIGVGPGAHGRLTKNGRRVATEAAKRPSAYIDTDDLSETVLTSTDTGLEFLAMALRPTHGLDLERYNQVFGAPTNPEIISRLTENELAHVSHGRLLLTQQGRLLADYIAAELTP
ncbi:MAG: radical SAM family heme chaperone HemW [Henriciella sp.]|nr:radical SAM family heme chaperone HemW [Henriciella sp.]